MNRLLWIRNGRVIDPARQLDQTGDVFVRDGMLAESLTAAEKKAAETLRKQPMTL